MIREFNAHDTDALVSIWRQASAVAHPFLPQEFIEQEAVNLREIYLRFAETWVCVIDGTVVGFVALVEDEIAGLFLHPGYHRRGLGREMVEFAVARNGPLRVEVFEKNHVGRRFYAACGFRAVDRFVHEPTGEDVLKLTLAKARSG